ncbi:GTP-binding protein, partial [Candidatus Hakubella thermalkaliphila]
QLDFPIIYTSARDGVAGAEPDQLADSLQPLFAAIIEHVPSPTGDATAPFQLLVANLAYDNYVGKYAIGRVLRGTLSAGDPVAVIHADGTIERGKINKVFVF